MADSMSVMTQVIESFTPLSKWTLDHKHLWFEYLETGKLQFSPSDLHNAIKEIADKPKNRPRGKKLLLFRKRYNFTFTKNFNTFNIHVLYAMKLI